MISRTGVEPGQTLAEVATPSLVIDLDRVDRNIATWQEIATRNGKRFRPHVKTHKIPEIALQQQAAGACGIAAAKPAELEPFVEAGCRDVVLAYPTVGTDKWQRLARLAREAKVTVNVDSDLGVRGLSAAATAAGVTVQVQIEIDTGLNRCGLDLADHAGIRSFATLIGTLPGLELEGVTTHRGKFNERLAAMTNEQAGREEGELLVEVAERLRADGFSIREVTAGGTISGRGVAEVAGITELRAGTYVFNDAMQVEFGAAGEHEVAAFILATVVSTRRPGWATVASILTAPSPAASTTDGPRCSSG